MKLENKLRIKDKWAQHAAPLQASRLYLRNLAKVLIGVIPKGAHLQRHVLHVIRHQLHRHWQGLVGGQQPHLRTIGQIVRHLPYLFVATLDERQWPVATLFSGPVGLLRSPDETHLRIVSPRRADDPAQAALYPGQPVGVLGLDFSNRRRNRVNGVISRTDKNRVEIRVQQSFGNCPQYIQRRELFGEPNVAAPIEQLSSLDDQARQLIVQADTCFVASYAHGELAQGGVDITSAWRFHQALGWRGRNVEFSPATLRTGIWQHHAENQF